MRALASDSLVKNEPEQGYVMAQHNADQVADWNGQSGERWVAHQARLDARLAVFGQESTADRVVLKVKIESFLKCRNQQTQALNRVVFKVSPQASRSSASASGILGCPVKPGNDI